MGTDIYLEWEGKTEGDKKKQITGFSIGSGDVGYLRASMGMVKENAVLRAVFPEKIWDPQQEKGEPYNFIENVSFLNAIIKQYLAGENIDVQNRMDSQQKQGKAILAMLETAGFESDQIIVSNSDDEDSEFKRTWVKSLIDFFKLGVKLQQQNKSPSIYISW